LFINIRIRIIFYQGIMGDFRILIVEDEGILAMNEQKCLLRLGYQVCGIADNGETAVELAKLHSPDIILMDIRIRGRLDGIQTAERIRRFSDTPILFTTAYSDEDTLSRSSKMAFAFYLDKPYQIRDLQEAIESCRSRTRRGDSAHNQENHAPENAGPVCAGESGDVFKPSFDGKE
jgi:two-component system, response regulator PdtaR